MKKPRNFVLSALVPLAMSALIVACDDNPQKYGPPKENVKHKGEQFDNTLHLSPWCGSDGQFISSNGVSTAGDKVSFDVVIRDFSVEHIDFENFSEEFVSKGDQNYFTIFKKIR